MNLNLYSYLVVELLTEELPPQALEKLAHFFAEKIVQLLEHENMLAENFSFQTIATPRRLGLIIDKVRRVNEAKQIREKVLPVSIAIDQYGQATNALTKKLITLGQENSSLNELERGYDKDGKTETLFITRTIPGKKLTDVLQQAIDTALAQLPIPRMMKYQNAMGDTVHFIRPARNLLALHGEDIVPIRALGLKAGRTSFGHRFLSSGELNINAAENYSSTLQHFGYVITNFDVRRQTISNALNQAISNEKILLTEKLLNEVTALVEWPIVYTCHFDDQFLAIPQECLILTMQTHQRYFALTDQNGKLLSKFLVVSNIASTHPEKIIEGNERVVRPRFADAEFFFQQDRQKTLSSRIPELAHVVYQKQLGSQLDRVHRITHIACTIAELLKDKYSDIKLEYIQRAAYLAKGDLLTEMINEFPELQGIMGAHYARLDGEPQEVAQACAEHYQPRFSGDHLPKTTTGIIVALADKVEILIGITNNHGLPKSDKDPFALRRHAIGIIRILAEYALPISLIKLFKLSSNHFQINFTHDLSQPLYEFCMDRLRIWLREKNYTINEINAVLESKPGSLDLILIKLDALRTFSQLPEANALIAANKRVQNILKKASYDHENNIFDKKLIRYPEEKILAEALNHLEPIVAQHIQEKNFTLALNALASLKAPIDNFFDNVIVNDENMTIRENRLRLLQQMYWIMNHIADISKLTN